MLDTSETRIHRDNVSVIPLPHPMAACVFVRNWSKLGLTALGRLEWSVQLQELSTHHDVSRDVAAMFE